MKMFLMAPVVLGCVLFAQDDMKPQPKTEEEKAPAQKSPAKVRRLESVTWNPDTAVLSWVVSNFDTLETEKAAPVSQDTYSIKMDGAIMKYKDEDRKFDPVGAKNVRTLMNLISLYAIESTVWWDQGSQGIGPGTQDDDKKGTEPTKAAPASQRGALAPNRPSQRTGAAAIARLGK